MDDAASRCHTGMCPDGCLLRAAGDATYGPICLGVETATGNFFGRVGGRWTDLSSQGPSPLSQVTPSLDRKRRSGQAGETRQGQGFTAKPRAQGLASAAVSSSHGSSAWNLHDRRPNGLILTPRPEKTRHPSLVNFTWLSRAGPDPDSLWRHRPPAPITLQRCSQSSPIFFLPLRDCLDHCTERGSGVDCNSVFSAGNRPGLTSISCLAAASDRASHLFIFFLSFFVCFLFFSSPPFLHLRLPGT